MEHDHTPKQVRSYLVQQRLCKYFLHISIFRHINRRGKDQNKTRISPLIRFNLVIPIATYKMSNQRAVLVCTLTMKNNN